MLDKRRSMDHPGKVPPWAVPLFFGMAAIEGLAVFGFLVGLPSDPDTRAVFGLSVSRLILLTGVALGGALFAALALKSGRNRLWAHKVAALMFGDPWIVPYALLFVVIVAVGAGGVLVLSWPEAVASLNPDRLLRLTPPALWVGLVAAQMGVTWLWIHKHDHVLALAAQSTKALAPLALYGISLAVRVPLTGHGLPYEGVWDEVVTYSQSMRMLTVPGLKPVSNVPGYGKTAYGDMLVYVTAAGEMMGLIEGLRTQQVTSVQEYVAPPAGVHSIYEAVHVSGIPLRAPRMLLAAINSLAPVALFLILRKHFETGSWPAFGGALAYGLLSRDVIYYSSFILPDALAATLLLFLLMAAFEGMADETARMAPWAACGVLVGMSVSVTIRVLAVGLVPVAAFALAVRRDRPFAKLVVLGLSAFAGFALTSPYALLDLPGYLTKLSSFSWNHELAVTHSFSSLVFYVRGIFASGFNSGYVDSTAGSVGLGALVGLLALLGLARGIVRFPRLVILIVLFSALHLYSILPVAQRYTRHALILYPLVCLMAGNGLALLSDTLRSWLSHYRAGRYASWKRVAPFLVLLVFLVASSRQVRLVLRYVQRMHRYQPSQVRASEYLNGVLQSSEKVGILEQIPWVEADLDRRGIAFERVPSTATLGDLRASKINYVVGTDRFGGDYISLSGRLWDNRFSAAGAKLAEFGDAPLQYQGYPSASLYLFIARVPDH